jgi:hypothetical protein
MQWLKASWLTEVLSWLAVCLCYRNDFAFRGTRNVTHLTVQKSEIVLVNSCQNSGAGLLAVSGFFYIMHVGALQ